MVFDDANLRIEHSSKTQPPKAPALDAVDSHMKTEDLGHIPLLRRGISILGFVKASCLQVKHTTAICIETHLRFAYFLNIESTHLSHLHG